MKDLHQILNNFILQSNTDNLKWSSYPKTFHDLNMKVSFGQGVPARVSWISFLAPEMQTSRGFYPVYLYYKIEKKLLIAYGVSETSEYPSTWPEEITNNKLKINEIQLQNDLVEIINSYKKTVSLEIKKESSIINQGLFYMEKQLEDFIIENWENTEFGKKYDLIYEDGELISQQFQTSIGKIDILAKDKIKNNIVVIELKKNQTSDETICQLARYMGWIKKNKKDEMVTGVIVAGQFDEKLDHARIMMPNIEVFLYQVDFKLKEYK